MGYEKTPPRNAVIAVSGVATIVVLIGLHFVFTSYFNSVKERYVRERILDAPVDEADRYREEQARQLHEGRPTIDDAIGAMAKRGRDVDPRITPQPSDALDALRGWNLRKNDARFAAAERAVAARVAEEEAAAAALVVDAGVAPPEEGIDVNVGAAANPAAPATRGGRAAAPGRVVRPAAVRPAAPTPAAPPSPAAPPAPPAAPPASP